jgi:hypothetical protein
VAVGLPCSHHRPDPGESWMSGTGQSPAGDTLKSRDYDLPTCELIAIPDRTQPVGTATNQWLLILVATSFNLVFEYSGRGIGTLFSDPLLLPALFALYFSLFTMVEDLIVRYRLRDYHFLVIVFFYGTVYEFFASGSPFFRQGFLGTDWVTLIFVNIVVWASVRGVLTFYLATRAYPRGPHTPLLGERGWILALIVNVIALALIHESGHVPAPGLVPLFVLAGILIISAVVFQSQARKTEWRSAYVPFRKSTILDLFCLITIVIFLSGALMPVHSPVVPYAVPDNGGALGISMVWACVTAVVLFMYRILKGEPVPV